MPTIARHVSRTKAERLVASGRLVLCSIAFAAASIGFAVHRGAAHDLLIGGAWWIFAAAVLVKIRRRPHARTTPLVLALDVAFVAALLLTTGGVTSVYFPMIVMPPFAANLLYGRREVLLTTAAGVATYLSMLMVMPAAIDPRVMIMRFGVVVILGVAVWLRSSYEARVERDIEHLATWPRTAATDRDAAVQELLARAAVTLHASRVAAAWTESGGMTYVAHFDDAHFEIEDQRAEDRRPATSSQQADGFLPSALRALPSDPFDGWFVPEAAGASSFLDPGLRTIGGVIEEWPGPFVASLLRERLLAQSILGAKFVSQTVDGWLFVLDRRDANADDLMLAEIVARLFSSGLDQVNLAVMMRDGAAAAERIRLSRDLHDGLLQSLSGLALHAEGARRAIDSDPRSAQRRLEIVVEQLVEGQRALRDFVDELRPELAVRRQSLHLRLTQMARGVAAQWSVAVDLDVARDLDALVRTNDCALETHLSSVVAEAITNAAKHAGAARVRAKIAIEGNDVLIDVEDDGRGFPFHGRYDLPRLLAEQRGPWSLKERVMSLGGQLVIDSSPRGSRVEVRLPLAS